jgi:hypothetical protein
MNGSGTLEGNVGRELEDDTQVVRAGGRLVRLDNADTAVGTLAS